MHDVAYPIPPFESFYETYRDEVLRFLRGRVGRDQADDAFQETFLRSLRAYDRLQHGEHLRAWVFTIATRVAIDVHRRLASRGRACRRSRTRTGVPRTRSSAT